MALTLAEANRILDGAIARARALNQEISVTVCNAEGRLVALGRMDGALATANREAIGKAIVAAASGRPSGEAEALVDFSLRSGTVIGEGAPVVRRSGGLPIFRDGMLEGACGVGGAADDETDEGCARAGVAAVSGGAAMRGLRGGALAFAAALAAAGGLWFLARQRSATDGVRHAPLPRRGAQRRRDQGLAWDKVDEASAGSFPASDPPGYYELGL